MKIAVLSVLLMMMTGCVWGRGGEKTATGWAEYGFIAPAEPYSADPRKPSGTRVISRNGSYQSSGCSTSYYHCDGHRHGCRCPWCDSGRCRGW